VIKNFYYRNEGNGIFIGDTLTFPDLTTLCSYGVACGDLNNDGSLDLVAATCKNQPQDDEPADLVYYNTPNANHWLKVRLNGFLSNRTAIGGKVKIKAMIDGTSVWQIREVSAQSGYCGQNSMTQHFGLKNAGIIDSLVVLWPSAVILTDLTGRPMNICRPVVEGSSLILDLHELAKGSYLVLICVDNKIYRDKIIRL
jgi:enediyne biosynthesis protein E4